MVAVDFFASGPYDHGGLVAEGLCWVFGCCNMRDGKGTSQGVAVELVAVAWVIRCAFGRRW